MYQKAPNKQNLLQVKLAKRRFKRGHDITSGSRFLKNVLPLQLITPVHICCRVHLKQVVGSHISQAGSYVCEDYLRFDFNHFEKLSKEQLVEIEDLVNQYIDANYSVTK